MKASEVVENMQNNLSSSFFIRDLSAAAQKLIIYKDDVGSIVSESALLYGGGARFKEFKSGSCMLKTSDLFKLKDIVLYDMDITNPTNKVITKAIDINDLVSKNVIYFCYCLLEEYEFYNYKNFIKEKIDVIDKERYSLSDFNKHGAEGIFNFAIERQMSSYQFQRCDKRLKSLSKLGLKVLDEFSLNNYSSISARRNELTHSTSPQKATMLEALSFMLVCRNLVKKISEIYQDASIQDLNIKWDLWEGIEHSTHPDDINEMQELLKELKNSS